MHLHGPLAICVCMKALLLVLVVTNASLLFSQQTFLKTYNGPGHYYDAGVDLLIDGNDFVFATGSFCDVDYTDCIQVIKTDSIGQIEWQTQIINFENQVETHSRNNLILTFEGNYLMAGAQYFQDSIDGSQAIIWKISSTGEILWETPFNELHVDYSRSVVQLPDSNIIVLAEGNPGTNLQNTTPWKMSLLSFSKEGQFLWYKPYNPDSTLYVPDSHSLVRTKSNELVTVFRHTSPELPWFKQMGIAKFDTLGNEIWTRLYEHKYRAVGDIYERADGNYIVFAKRDTFIPGCACPIDLVVFCHDTAGNRLWEKNIYIGGVDNDIWDLNILPDGDMAIIGSFYVKPQKESLAWLVRMDSTGNVKWQRFFDSKYPYYQHGRLEFFDLESLPDGRLAILGSIVDTVPEIAGYEWNAMLLVLDSLGKLAPGGDTTVLHSTTALHEIAGFEQKNEPFLLFPNPASSTVLFSTGDWMDGQLQIFDPSGRLVKTVQVPRTLVFQFNVEDLPTGIYFVKWTDGKRDWPMQKLAVVTN